MSHPVTTPRHPIRIAARRAGLSPATLRAWEKRYHAVAPDRTGSGHRLYTDGQVERLRLIKAVVDRGRRPSSVAGLSDEDLRGLLVGDAAATRSEVRARGGAGAVALARTREAAMEAILTMDGPGLESLLKRACVTEGLTRFMDQVLIPVLRGVGDGWVSGRVGSASEHIASGVIGRILGWLLRALARGPDVPLLVVGTPAGQAHEFGALMAGICAADLGWRVAYLGRDLPADELARGVSRLGGSVIALSAISTGEEERVAHEVDCLRDLLDARVRIVVGGPGAIRVSAGPESGVHVLSDLGELRELLAPLTALCST